MYSSCWMGPVGGKLEGWRGGNKSAQIRFFFQSLRATSSGFSKMWHFFLHLLLCTSVLLFWPNVDTFFLLMSICGSVVSEFWQYPFFYHSLLLWSTLHNILSSCVYVWFCCQQILTFLISFSVSLLLLVFWHNFLGFLSSYVYLCFCIKSTFDSSFLLLQSFSSSVLCFFLLLSFCAVNSNSEQLLTGC